MVLIKQHRTATIPQVLYFTNIITEITGNFIVGVSKEAKFQVMTVSGNKRVWWRLQCVKSIKQDYFNGPGPDHS